LSNFWQFNCSTEIGRGNSEWQLGLRRLFLLKTNLLLYFGEKNGKKERKEVLKNPISKSLLRNGFR